MVGQKYQSGQNHRAKECYPLLLVVKIGCKLFGKPIMLIKNEIRLLYGPAISRLGMNIKYNTDSLHMWSRSHVQKPTAVFMQRKTDNIPQTGNNSNAHKKYNVLINCCIIIHWIDIQSENDKLELNVSTSINVIKA